MKRMTLPIAILALCLGGGWALARQDRGSVAAADRQFMTHAAQGGMAEVRLGQLASDHANADAVKQFGQRMVQDHSKANDELSQLAQRKGVDLPKDLDTEQQATMDRLSKLSGSEFDRAYIRDMVRDHVEDVREFQRESRTAQDADLKAWVTKTLPTLQEHLRMARTVARQQGAAGAVERNEGAGTGEGKK